MNILVVNCGSSSLKFDLLTMPEGREIASGHVERIGAVAALATFQVGDDKPMRESLDAGDHSAALEFLLQQLRDHPGIEGDGNVEAVGHRVVHGGEQFAESVLIDEEVITAIRDAFDLAPLHNPANLKGIQAAQQAFPDVPHIAVFDTAFHQTLAPRAYLYALPNRLYRRHKMRRYGFHGTSYAFVSRRLYELAGLQPDASKVIICHLGNGCSMAAIRDGKSVDTSMGMTPVAGLVMGTRCGDIDPSLIFDIVDKEEMTLAEVHALLNRYSGLLGLSGYAGDMRDLLEEADKGDVRCQQAVEVFCYQIKRYLGMYMAALNGCDAIAFTAGIGTYSDVIRAQVCADLDGLGIELDAGRNASGNGSETKISADDNRVQVWVVPTNEELVIAQDAMKLAIATKKSPYA